MKKLGIRHFILIIVILVVIIKFCYYKIEIKPYITKICGVSALTITTGSMKPNIDIGDMIIIKQYPRYEIGDIITYQIDNKYLVTHRIIKKDENTYITKGDSNNIEDEPVDKAQIEGKVVFYSKLLGKIEQYNVEILIIFTILILIMLKKSTVVSC